MAFKRLTSVFGRLFGRRSKRQLIKDVHGDKLFKNNSNESEITRFSRQLLQEIKTNEQLITPFKNVERVRVPIDVNVEFYTPKRGEQISFRSIVVTPDGRTYHIEAAFRTGEKWSFTRFKSIVRGKMVNLIGIEDGISAFIDSSVTTTQYYSQTHRPINVPL